MSELKHQLMLNKNMSWVPCYLKSEADKVIAEKDAEIARLKAIRKVHIEAIESMGAGLLQNDEEIRHQKYKRCLAMAEACMHKRWRTDEGFDYARSTRHMNKWLEIAEQFKPNNSTDQ